MALKLSLCLCACRSHQLHSQQTQCPLSWTQHNLTSLVPEGQRPEATLYTSQEHLHTEDIYTCSPGLNSPKQPHVGPPPCSSAIPQLCLPPAPHSPPVLAWPPTWPLPGTVARTQPLPAAILGLPHSGAVGTGPWLGRPSTAPQISEQQLPHTSLCKCAAWFPLQLMEINVHV